ncbi:MAG TPA: cupin domain-containing protein [Tenuifilaceae bacterium]|nr:cupin domain-containing protein [Tenuifilaceae bacterium]HPE19032.1 cupin domain-containing protein [Tenuifilaceae bacterium]HPJ46452.1 cupin domain-containing protein [Tenuifilaceae bacterium]HPQ33933.1 cupin domain-containing protein [Tenuifilaceae bacterium]HRX67889.1 cupin domain-containing protein [Tenuifilaceae bacterium]
MRSISLDNAEKVPFNLDGRKMFISEKVEIIHLTLKPGEVLDKHTNPFNVVFYILEGSGVVETEDESKLVEPDMTIEIQKGIPRGIKNTSNHILRLLVVKIL